MSDVGITVNNGFNPIQGDSDFMMRMQAGEFDDYDNNPEMQKAIMDYLGQEEAKSSPIKDFSSLGMSAAKVMSGFAQATPLQGLMGMVNSGGRGLFGG